MHQQTLFAFDTLNCKRDNLDGNINKLDLFVSSLGFQIVPVPKDGDCLFTSVIFQLDQMAPLSDSNELSAFIETLKLCSTALDKVLLLRGKLVDEWLSNKEECESTSSCTKRPLIPCMVTTFSTLTDLVVYYS